jgi:hypothetical protein
MVVAVPPGNRSWEHVTGDENSHLTAILDHSIKVNTIRTGLPSGGPFLAKTLKPESGGSRLCDRQPANPAEQQGGG